MKKFGLLHKHFSMEVFQISNEFKLFRFKHGKCNTRK